MYETERLFMRDTSLAANGSYGPLAAPCPAAKSLPEDACPVRLPEPELLPDKTVNFLELVELRTTIRQYKDKPLTMKELSFLLWCTQGVKMPLPGEGSMRTVPSAGARHALETYLLVQRVDGLTTGVYRFLPFEHALLPLAAEGLAPEKTIAAFKQKDMVAASAVTFIWAAVPGRMAGKFGPRAYRYLLLDAGHVCQNLYLAAHVLGIGTCAIGAFFDGELNGALALDGETEFALYSATVGKALG